MRVIDMLSSSRRMFFENVVAGFEYTGRGSCFLCRYRGQDFVVALSHVIDGYAPDAIRVLFHQNARDFVPQKAQLSIKALDASAHEDPDWTQIVLFPLERSLYADDQFADQQPYPILARECRWLPDMDGHFITRGFPHDYSYIDYDRLILKEQAVILEAHLIGNSPMRHCYEIEFNDMSHCTDLDGFSGAPVFWIGAGTPRDHRFAGVIVRATYASGKGHFIHADVILSALEQAINHNPL